MGRYARGMATLISTNTVECDKLGMDLRINWKAGLHESGKSSGSENDENICPVEW